MGKNAYFQLMEKLGYPDSDILLEILSCSMTLDEASFLLQLPLPINEIAIRLQLDETSAGSKLHNYLCRGLIKPSRQGYRFPRDVTELHDTSLSSSPQYIPEELPQLWKNFYESSWYGELAEQLCEYKKPFLRVVPAQKSISNKSDLFPWEDISLIIKAARTVAVRNCCCRVMAKECNSPIHTCLQFNRRADYTLERDDSSALTKEEALEVALAAEDAGLVPMVANIANMEGQDYICYCCSCCCIALNPLKRTDKTKDGIAPSRFIARVDPELCIGCKLCIKRCHFEAITLDESHDPEKTTASIINENCFGCGSCVINCKQNAITLELIRPPEHIPNT